MNALGVAFDEHTDETVGSLVKPIVHVLTFGLFGFWLVWQIQGGFESFRNPGRWRNHFYTSRTEANQQDFYKTTNWHPAIPSAGLLRARSNGTHALRHFCASTWLEHGVSIRAVAEYLGHSDPGFTLRIYTHLMPNSDQGARDSFKSLQF